ncbi:MAG: hypothetical protein AB1673_05705 [Actinomycetota bacterium]|jgi:hypothetical protein
MPWCEECSAYRADGDLSATGGCPQCGQELGPPPKAPWHFKLLVVALVVYLGWRAVQGVDWLVARF